MFIKKDATFQPLQIAVLTVSDTRTLQDDTSGSTLVECITKADHVVAGREIVKDDVYLLRAVFSQWIADSTVDVIIATGGTGLTGRDVTPKAVKPLLDKDIPGFGELFRMLSYEEIGTSTIESLALGGVANGTLIFSIPGSTRACRTAWERILQLQLDSRTGPCNLVEVRTRFFE